MNLGPENQIAVHAQGTPAQVQKFLDEIKKTEKITATDVDFNSPVQDNETTFASPTGSVSESGSKSKGSSGVKSGDRPSKITIAGKPVVDGNTILRVSQVLVRFVA